MNITTANISDFPRLQRTGLIAHMMAVTHFIHRESMEKLAETQRYPKLSLAYEGYITLLAERDYSPGELAERLDITKQACSKTIKELEQIGLLQRRSNPEDSRSSLLSLTGKGLQLIQDGVNLTNEIQQRFAEAVGAEKLKALAGILEKLCVELEVEVPRYKVLETIGHGSKGRQPRRLNLLLPILNHYFYQSLIDSLSEKGFKGLKPNFSQVLSLIVLDQGRIQYIASVAGVSKQAIAVIANELERLGYIAKEADPHDKRQVILRLTPLGQRLLAESESSVQALVGRLEKILGSKEYEVLETTMAALYAQGIDHHGLPNALPANIEQLSRHLLEELGVAGARALAQHLLTITRGNI